KVTKFTLHGRAQQIEGLLSPGSKVVTKSVAQVHIRQSFIDGIPDEKCNAVIRIDS
ncbi:hypothetical protein E4U47_002570, partial [Claviceps purpurea]